VALSKAGPVWATDANPALIALYQAVQQGWVPPEQATDEQRKQALQLPDSDPMKAFLRIGCGFSGNWSSGFARDSHGRNYAAQAQRCLLRDVSGLKTQIQHLDFLDVAPRPINAKLYCDPPYAGTTGYAGAPPFDSALFCLRVAEWSRYTDVFVSEYQFPLGVCIWQRAQKTTVAAGTSGKSKTAVEKLFFIAKGSLTA
jgi:DNA adenine methylase